MIAMNIPDLSQQAQQQAAVTQARIENLIISTAQGIYLRRCKELLDHCPNKPTKLPAETYREAAAESHRAAMFLGEAFGMLKVNE